jgi:hypothetical protein
MLLLVMWVDMQGEASAQKMYVTDIVSPLCCCHAAVSLLHLLLSSTLTW